MKTRILARRCFVIDDQQWFATFSGDFNPLHVDPVYARRTMMGAPVVHGVHALLWALEAFLASRNGAEGVSSLSVRFQRPVYLGRRIVVYRPTRAADGEWNLEAWCGDVRLLDATIRLGTLIPPVEAPSPPPSCRITPVDRSFAELSGLRGREPLWLDRGQADKRFPATLTALGPIGLAVILALTRLVGMEAPGLHSLFSSFELIFDRPTAKDHELCYSLEGVRLPYVPVELAVTAPGTRGIVKALYSPIPTTQPAMDTIATTVEPAEFAGQAALIVGGTRGLGELIAKIVSAGGGTAIVTWCHGEIDARRVLLEIGDAGGRAEALHLDVLQPTPGIRELTKRGLKPTHVYYCATPRISDPVRATHDSNWRRVLEAYYLDGFRNLVVALATVGPIRAFYPSTVFIDELPRGEAEYVAVKAAGEVVCRYLEKYVPGFSAVISRLPRLPTDQTQSLIKPAMADPVATLLPLIREMHRSERSASRGDVGASPTERAQPPNPTL